MNRGGANGQGAYGPAAGGGLPAGGGARAARGLPRRGVTRAVVTLLAALLSLCATPHPAYTAGWPGTVQSAPAPSASHGNAAADTRERAAEDGEARAEEHWQAAPVHLAVLQPPVDQPAPGGPGPALPARAADLPVPAGHREPAAGHSERPAAGPGTDALPEVRGPPAADRP